MWSPIQSLDRLLRGEATALPALRAGDLNIPVLGLAVVIDVLGLIYGACMGLFAVTTGGSGYAMQVPASMVKVPALFLLTLVITFPSLYVFNALVGSRLLMVSVLRLLVGSLAVMLAILASLGPIVAFFSLSTTSYPFMVLLNVVVFALSGFLGLAFLLQTLHRMTVARHLAPAAQVATDVTSTFEIPPIPRGGPLDLTEDHVLARHVKSVFRIWLAVFGLVGAQMGWVLRPFIGAPGQPFEWFRTPDSNFFQAVVRQIFALLGH